MISIDLFAGSGWSVASRRLGIRDLGAEKMPEARGTRDLNGFETPWSDVSQIEASDLPSHEIQIGGPPCQTFSPAGGGEGRRALPRVLAGIDVVCSGERFRPDDGDPRTWLVLEPLRLALAAMPLYIVWEQVTPVLPVWVACAERALRPAGYSTWTGVLNSEQYGVPQTRRRAFMIARRDGVIAAPPVPTHSKYHTRQPDKLDSGVLPWVSMAQGIGWGMPARPSFTVTGGGAATGGADPFGHGARDAMLSYRSSGLPNATVRREDQPAPTVMFGKAAGDVEWVYQNGNQPNSAERELSQPAPTVHFGARSNAVNWVQRSNYTTNGGQTTPSPVQGSPPRGMRHLDQPSITMTSKPPHWATARPSTTVLGDPRIAHPGHRDRVSGESQFSPDLSIRVTTAEAAALQTFPADHQFAGKSGKVYLQIGNAVPPTLAEVILRTFLKGK